MILNYFWVRDLYLSQAKKGMEKVINTLGFMLKCTDDLEIISKKIKKNTALRVTFISQNGKVLADSDKNKDKNKTFLKNHLNRPEIKNSTFRHFTFAIRSSKTLHEQLLYVAKKIKFQNQHFVYLRLSKNLIPLKKEFFILSSEISAIFAFFLLLVFSTTLVLSKNIRNETEQILYFLKNILSKKRLDKDYIIPYSNYSLEFYKISQFIKKLAERLEKKDRQNLKKASKLKLSSRQKDEIISALAHEFKNPLSIIDGYAQILISDELEAKQQKEFLEKIVFSSRKMSKLIDKLRLTNKLEKEQFSQDFKIYELHELVFEIVNNIDPKYTKRKITIKGYKKIEVDKALFEVAFENLLENALKYSNDEIQININDTCLEVLDFGIGIEEFELEKIKQKFYKVNKNNWDNSLGLGLFIVYKIVSLHGFELEIKARENRGMNFSIIF